MKNITMNYSKKNNVNLKPHKKIRIAIISSPWYSVPPSGYGGIERMIDNIAVGLKNRGYDITLFCANGSSSKVRRVFTHKTPLAQKKFLSLT